MYGSNCKEAEREGVSVLHGNRGVYHDDKQPTFRALYEAIRDVSVLVKADTCLSAFNASSAMVHGGCEGQPLPGGTPVPSVILWSKSSG